MGAAEKTVITDLDICNNFPTFVVTIDKDMETTVIRIGNSRGIIIPSAILKKLGVKEGAKVQLEEKEGGVLALSFLPEEEPFTGPFTGPFKELAEYVDADAFGGRDMDPVEYIRQLRDDSKAEKRELPDWTEW